MKRLAVLAFLFAGGVDLLAQGTVWFGAYVGGDELAVHIYSPQAQNPAVEVTGNSPTDIPAGTTVYTGVPLGGASTGSGATAWGNGNNFTAQLYAAAGDNQPAASLQPVTQYRSTFYTVAFGAGFFQPAGSVMDPGIPGASAGSATCQLRAWYNAGGTIPSYAAAVAAGVPYGASLAFNIDNLGGSGYPPIPPPNLVGLQSFSLISPPVSPVPEPSALVLSVIGVSAFLLRRR